MPTLPALAELEIDVLASLSATEGEVTPDVGIMMDTLELHRKEKVQGYYQRILDLRAEAGRHEGEAKVRAAEAQRIAQRGKAKANEADRLEWLLKNYMERFGHTALAGNFVRAKLEMKGGATPILLKEPNIEKVPEQFLKPPAPREIDKEGALRKALDAGDPAALAIGYFGERGTRLAFR